MPRNLALITCLAFILWLLARYQKRQKGVSTAVWIPVLWALMLGSRPVSIWLGIGKQLNTLDDYLEGSPFDRLVFLVLITAGFLILSKRRANWQSIILNNRWLFLYFLYLGISTVWSDYSFLSFKRWVKDFGHLVLALVILSEDDPTEAVKAVLARCSYVLIPLSVLFIKYYPDLGRYYDSWTYQPHYSGVTTDKNMLGMVVFSCGLFLFWMLIELRNRETQDRDMLGMFVHLVLMLMVLWLLAKAQSSTALSCGILGACILLGMRLPAIRSRVRRLGVYIFAFLLLLLLLQVTFDLGAIFVKAVGRDLTFTGRTEIWKATLNEDINPLFGVGYYSFWLGDRSERLSEKYYYLLNEAHNGYLETYLNNGLIGLLLLTVVFVSAAKRIHRRIIVYAKSNYEALRLAFLVAALAYNMTEVVFDRLNLVWFVFLLLIMRYPGPLQVRVRNAQPRGAHLDTTTSGPRTVPVRSSMAGVKSPECSRTPRPSDVLLRRSHE